MLMLSIGLWQRYIVTNTILDIIHSPVFYLKHNVSGPQTEIISLCWAELSKFRLKTETESSLRNVVF
jgi:hypothetical protein